MTLPTAGYKSLLPVRKMSNVLTTTEEDLIEPIHPGEILMEDFISGFGITQHALAVSIDVPPRRINEIVHGKRGITADVALRLARFSVRLKSFGCTSRRTTNGVFNALTSASRFNTQPNTLLNTQLECVK